MVNICVAALNAALSPFAMWNQRGQGCGRDGYLQKLEHSQALNLNWRLRVSIKPLARHSISRRTWCSSTWNTHTWNTHTHRVAKVSYTQVHTHTFPVHTHKWMQQMAPTCPNTESTMGSRSTGSASSGPLSLLCGPSIISSSASSSVSLSSAAAAVVWGLWPGFWWRGGWGVAVWTSPAPPPCSLVRFFCFSSFFLMAACTWGGGGQSGQICEISVWTQTHHGEIKTNVHRCKTWWWVAQMSQ